MARGQVSDRLHLVKLTSTICLTLPVHGNAQPGEYRILISGHQTVQRLLSCLQDLIRILHKDLYCYFKFEVLTYSSYSDYRDKVDK